MKRLGVSNGKRTLILDLGNVVLDWDVERVLDSLGLGIEQTMLLREELFGHQDWLDMDHGKATEASVVSRVSERTKLAKAVVGRAMMAAKDSLRPFDESVELMREVAERGIAMYCLSNMSREIYAHIQGQAFFELFEGIVISGIEGCMKPDAAIFELLVSRFELSPADTLFVDDSLLNVQAAQGVGVNALHFQRSPNCYGKIREFLF